MINHLFLKVNKIFAVAHIIVMENVEGCTRHQRYGQFVFIIACCNSDTYLSASIFPLIHSLSLAVNESLNKNSHTHPRA